MGGQTAHGKKIFTAYSIGNRVQRENWRMKSLPAVLQLKSEEEKNGGASFSLAGEGSVVP